jgi:hypothetical protein
MIHGLLKIEGLFPFILTPPKCEFLRKELRAFGERGPVSGKTLFWSSKAFVFHKSLNIFLLALAFII